ncbi:alginate lyase family protein [Microbacterium sp. zg.Y625]|uniref:alginate lyase family protein n=1 Tax=Microbacterium jiangjiandongii TaxID=3049071 RepID=UPI00214BBFE5|nr:MULTISPECIES: alginate lyase family protein [unclassified Microbacterium]MCR2793525.1 alginate lyase family protein [Microbacterium sp. zg.Y625]WIM25879.1 alginate lyase family protein [Microbacterium sp. zg-Y625]
MTSYILTYLDYSELRFVRDQFRAGEPEIVSAVTELTREADSLLGIPPASVTDKTALAASGNPHDFYAIGGYSWPNPETPDGLPYQYRDSETNPEALNSTAFDKGRYEDMTARVATLGLAYFYTSDTRYSTHATRLLRAWFIDPTTRMNPHFRYAAARPGVWDGHFTGTIEGVFLIEMLDYVALIGDSSEWTSSDDEALRSWFRELSDWLAHSPFGRREIFSTNNHGSYLLAQILAFATYGREYERARRVIPLARRELRRQIRPDGSMPLEIDRADGWFYSVYGLRAFTVLARLAEHYGENLWNRGALAQACASLAPYLTGATAWTFTRGHKPWEHDAIQLYHLAARAYRSADLLSTAMTIANESSEPLRDQTLLGLPATDVTGGHKRIPLAQHWTHASLPKRGPVSAGSKLTARALGALCARGLWPGRALP